MKNFQRVVAAMAALLVTNINAAVQGTLGSTSSASTDITMEIVDRININDIEDIDLGKFNGIDDLVGGSAFCVFRNGGDDYELIITDADLVSQKPGGKNKFSLTSVKANESIEFTVKVDDDNDASDGSSIANGESIQFSGSKEINCSTHGENASIEIRVLASEMNILSTGDDYNGTLVLNVAPI